MKNPQEVVQRMLEQDHFSQWMELKVNSIAEGTSTVSMFVKQEMLNGFGVIHGGVLFSLADSAFAFACNSRDNLTLALDAQINFIKKAVRGDLLTASVEEVHSGKTTGVYEVKIRNQASDLIAVFRGTAYRTGKSLFENKD
ncbi:MAG: hydroxyphenylacetyl-CoA thioesterase PaaI [Proteobacteria bacterium]|nr:hydroxyphenylacetyl-CoA thioesterase PaaI [Pseudomonadota bacterium]